MASGGVTMAAGAMISLSFAVSPPLTLLPPRPDLVNASGNVTSPQHRTIETVGLAVTDTFERRWQPATDAPLKPVARRDPLEGLIGGLPILTPAEIAPQALQVEALAAAPQPDKQEPVKVALKESPARSSDVCVRHGLRRVDYTQNHHRYWRCAGRR